MTRILVPTLATLTLSINVYAVVVVRFAPTPSTPLLYDTTPPVIFAKVLGVAAKQESCMFRPWIKSSTYCLLTASVALLGVATDVILALLASIVPLPVGCKNIE